MPEIGRIVGISSPAVSERIKKMEDVGIINGYKTIVSSYEVGYQLKAIITIRAFMGKLKPFLIKVKSFDEVLNCYRITGNENIVLEVMLNKSKTFRTIYRSINKLWRNKNTNCTLECY